MHTITKEIGIDAGHRVTYHESKCRNLHGHRYRIIACLEGDLTPDEAEKSDSGMVLDFTVVKEALMLLDRMYDHKLILWVKDPLVVRPGFLPFLETEGILRGVVTVPCVPTAENLAKLWYGQLYAHMRDNGLFDGDRVKLVSVTVWETPTSMACYEPDVGWVPAL